MTETQSHKRMKLSSTNNPTEGMVKTEVAAVDRMTHNPVILQNIFGFLSPAELKCAALVCRTWCHVLQLPRFWSWAAVSLNKENFRERTDSRRFRSIRRVLIGFDVSEVEWRSLFLTARCRNMRSLSLSRADLSSVSPGLLSRAAVRLERVECRHTFLSSLQISALFSEILETRPLTLRTLKLAHTSLASVPPSVLARAVVRLEEFPLLSSANLSTEQINCVLGEIEASQEVRLRKVRFHHLDLSSVPPHVFSQAVLRLEDVDLYASHLTEQQIETLLVKIGSSEQVEVRSVRVVSKEASSPLLLHVSPAVLAQALVRLETVNITNFILSPEQGKAVFKAVVSCPGLKLSRLTIVAGLYLLFAKRCEDYLAGALARLETVNILGVCFKPKVATAICQKIVVNEKLKLKSLKLWKSQDFPVSDELLKKVKERINLDFAQV